MSAANPNAFSTRANDQHNGRRACISCASLQVDIGGQQGSWLCKNLHIQTGADMMSKLKPLEFLGSSQKDLREMPAEVRYELGLELMVVQYGGEPSDFTPMPEVGAGTYEIRYRDVSGAFRVMYVAKFAEAVYVLHAFQKKTQKTAKCDIDLAAKRYRMIGTRP